jgi:hypothetical protein
MDNAKDKAKDAMRSGAEKDKQAFENTRDAVRDAARTGAEKDKQAFENARGAAREKIDQVKKDIETSPEESDDE